MTNPRQPPPGLIPALRAASAGFRNRAYLATDRAASKNFRDWARAIDRHIADLEEELTR